MALVHQLEGLERAGERFGVADRALAGDGADIVGDLTAAIVLRDQRDDERARRALRFAQRREDVGLLEHPLVVILAEIAEQLRGFPQRLGIDGSAGAQLGRALAIDQQSAAQDPVLAHQILDRADLFFLFWLRRRLGFLRLLGRKRGA